jgi:phosphate transport system substrate-binding protein
MSQKNETSLLVLAFLITLGLLGIGLWLFAGQFGDITSNPAETSQNNGSDTQTQASNPQTLNQVKNVPTGLISYGGSTSWAPIRKEVDPLIQTVFPEFQLRYTGPNSEAANSTTGVSMLLKSQLEFAQASRPVSKEEYEDARKRGIQLREIPVAIDGLAVVVHPSLNIPGLTVTQFEEIFAGKITNWKQIGGPDLKIQPYGKKGRDTGNYYKLTSTTTEAIRKVANDSSGVYWAGAPLLVAQCGIKPLPIGRDTNQLIPPYRLPFIPPTECPAKRNIVNTFAIRNGDYPLSRRLIVVVKKNGQFEQQAGEAYANLLLTDEGQKLIDKAGFVRIR